MEHNINKYITSGLIMESSNISKARIRDPKSGAFSEEDIGVCKISRLVISDQSDSVEWGCDMGRYVTISTKSLYSLSDREKAEVSAVITRELKTVVEHRGIKISEDMTALVVGIGNRSILSDALGPMSVEKISATRHIKLIDEECFKRMKCCSLCCMSCGVMADTGMQSQEIIKALSKEISPSLIIAIDALSAREYNRLGNTVQISDRGIAPGSGVGIGTGNLSEETLGAPTIAIGVPTVVSATTLIADTLRRHSIELSETSERTLTESEKLFVAPKECDIIVNEAASIIARAIESTFILGI